MENKEKKSGWKLNAFDIIILAVVVVAAAVLLMVWRSSGKSSDTSGASAKPVHYTVEITNMVGDTASKIKAGDDVYDSVKKYAMGTVVDVTLAATTTPEQNLETGDTVQSVVPGRQTATIDLLCDCTATDSQVATRSGYVLKVGQEAHIAGPGYAGLGYIVAIDRGDLDK